MAKRRQKKPLDRVRNVQRTIHCSVRTEQAYVSCIRRFIPFCDSKRLPKETGATEIEECITYLTVGSECGGLYPRAGPQPATVSSPERVHERL